MISDVVTIVGIVNVIIEIILKGLVKTTIDIEISNFDAPTAALKTHLCVDYGQLIRQ